MSEDEIFVKHSVFLLSFSDLQAVLLTSVTNNQNACLLATVIPVQVFSLS